MNQREKALERKITREYQKAYREIAQKAETYFKKFDAKDQQQKELLQQGKITNKQYLDWRKSWLRRTKEYNAMLNDCAEIVTNAGVISSAYVRGEQIDMYATGANWAAYDVCYELNLDLDFTVYDKKNVMRILRDNPELLPDMSEQAKANIPKTMRWNKGHIQSEITQGIIQGKAAKDVAKGLARAVGMDKNASIRNARTGLASARSAGTNNRYKEARDRFGIDIKKQWLATLDGKTRHEHRELDGQIRDLDEPFVIDGEEIQYPADPKAAPWLVYNCRCTLVDVIGKYNNNINAGFLDAKSYEEWERQGKRHKKRR